MQGLMKVIEAEIKKLGQQYGVNPVAELKGDAIIVKISGEEISSAIIQMIKPEYRPFVKVKAGEIVIELWLR